MLHVPSARPAAAARSKVDRLASIGAGKGRLSGSKGKLVVKSHGRISQTPLHNGQMMKFSPSRYDDLLDLLRWRRDVRHFKTGPIAADTLAQIEAAIDLAPSVGNSRPWRIVRVISPDIRDAVIRCFQEANEVAAQTYCFEEQREYRALKLAGLVEAPVHIAFFTDLAPAEGRGLGRQTMPETLLYSTVMAIHTLWLAARALNVGVGWVSILDPEAVGRALGVPENWQFTGYLCLGYPQEDSATPELHLRGWQQNAGSVWIER